jgi:hypothetical protein
VGVEEGDKLLLCANFCSVERWQKVVEKLETVLKNDYVFSNIIVR